ncbi:MAG: cysteine hydrolase [Thaumarchaeota archaeon]|nr:cysteine hydrolase [Nitrososphaerota archaeon]
MRSPGSRSGIGIAAVVALIIGLVIGAGAVLIVQPGATTTTQTSTVTNTTTIPQTTTVTTTIPQTTTLTTTATSIATTTATSVATSIITSTATSISTSTATSTTSITTTVTNSTSGFPTLPVPVAVSVSPKTTAMLVLDYAFCGRMVGCNATLPAVSNLLTKARAAGVLVIFTRVPVPAPITNQTGETVITNDVGPDKYLNTSLASILQSHGIKTLVVTGISSTGALLYTAQESCARKFTVVVAADTIFGTPFVQTYVPYQLLNGPGCSNAANTPLSAGRATLSTTSLINFTG